MKTDVNDTLRCEGPDAVRARHDRAAVHKPNGKQHGVGINPEARHLPQPSKPMAVARVFVTDRCNQDGDLTLRYWHGAWWSWRGSHWQEVEPRSVRSMLYEFTEHAVWRRR